MTTDLEVTACAMKLKMNIPLQENYFDNVTEYPKH
jgi:hypothetical protein